MRTYLAKLPDDLCTQVLKLRHAIRSDQRPDALLRMKWWDETSGKGTTRFLSDQDLPTSLVAWLVTTGIAEWRKKAKARNELRVRL
ncbi:MAG: hypothetical protein ACR2JB_16185 [Bryobacteraceae bacterium]